MTLVSHRYVRGLATGVFALLILGLEGCSGGSGSGLDQAASALGTDGGTASAADAAACLTTYANAVRAGTGDDDAKDAKKALHDCLRPPPPAGGMDGGCDHGGPGGGHGGPPGPRPEGDAGEHPPPPAPPDGPHGDHHHRSGACIDALETCAKGTDAIVACVATANACIAALPPPPAGGRR